MDVLLLSRIQFALTIAFHYIYPPLSIGLGLILVIMEGLYLATKKKLYHKMARFKENFSLILFPAFNILTIMDIPWAVQRKKEFFAMVCSSLNILMLLMIVFAGMFPIIVLYVEST